MLKISVVFKNDQMIQAFTDPLAAEKYRNKMVTEYKYQEGETRVVIHIETTWLEMKSYE